MRFFTTEHPILDAPLYYYILCVRLWIFQVALESELVDI
jgi:hypothetical protein